jgi:toxin ParE1/3/4
MKFYFHPEAEKEFQEAVEYFERYKPGLGYDFSIEMRKAIQNILGFPNAWPIIFKGVRRCLIKRFPYGVLYSLDHGNILILAVMHLSRHPDYWKERN